MLHLISSLLGFGESVLRLGRASLLKDKIGFHQYWFLWENLISWSDNMNLFIRVHADSSEAESYVMEFIMNLWNSSYSEIYSCALFVGDFFVHLLLNFCVYDKHFNFFFNNYLNHFFTCRDIIYYLQQMFVSLKTSCTSSSAFFFHWCCNFIWSIFILFTVVVPNRALVLDWVFADGPPHQARVYDNNDRQDFRAIVPRRVPEDHYWVEEEHQIYQNLQEERRIREEAICAKVDVLKNIFKRCCQNGTLISILYDAKLME